MLDNDQLAAGLGVCVRIAKDSNPPFAIIGGGEKSVRGQALEVLAECAVATAPAHEQTVAARYFRRSMREGK